MTERKAKYVYVKLNSVKIHDKVDVYGVVKFFKQPYKSRGSDYCMMISIVDQSYTNPMDKLKCLLFSKEESKLPPVKLGSIVRFHRLSINAFRDSQQGQNGPGFSWLLFSGDVSGPLEPLKSSSATYTITDTDRNKIRELRCWAINMEDLHEKLCAFNEVAIGCYFDLVCQVVHLSVIEDDVGRLLKVWDGTQCIYATRSVTADLQEKDVQKDEQLIKKANGFLYDVCVFDSHFRSSTNITPGDYVKFINLHAAEYRSPSNRGNLQPTVEFVLHRGNSFGRSVRVLSPDNVDLDTMKQRQEIVAMENDSFHYSDVLVSSESQEVVNGANNREPVSSTSGEPGDNAKQKSTLRTSDNSFNSSEVILISSESSEIVNVANNREPVPSTSWVPAISPSRSNLKCAADGERRPSTERQLHTVSESRKCLKRSYIANDKDVLVQKSKSEQMGNEENDINAGGSKVKDSAESSAASSIPRCMIQTNTVIINHHHAQRSKIREVLEHAIPYKFRVKAQVYEYHPKPTLVKTFLRLYCATCHYLCPYPGSNCNGNSRSELQLQIGSTFKGVPHYNCPQCLQQQDSLHGLDSPPHLQFIYMLRFILRDSSGMLMANIWKGDAVQFFQDIEPEELLKQTSNLELIKDCLNRVCPDDTEADDRPWIECCLKSYSVADGAGYQIFDTVVV